MTFNHEPSGYVCPFCQTSADDSGVGIWEPGIVYQNDNVRVFMAMHSFPNNKGNVLVTPIAHHENIHDIPDDLLASVHILGKRVARAMMEAYGCDGIAFRQHNAPAGSQDVWHYHLHVFPRYDRDGHYRQTYADWKQVPAEQRLTYAEKLRAWFVANP